jgi:hypothetical protein
MKYNLQNLPNRLCLKVNSATFGKCYYVSDVWEDI